MQYEKLLLYIKKIYVMNFDRIKKVIEKNNYSVIDVKPGQLLEIHEKIWEGDNNRIWKFKWLVIKVQKPNHADGTFIVRWMVADVSVEKIYPLSFNKFDKVILLDEFKARKSKLYYLRDKVGKAAKMKSMIKQGDRKADILKKDAK